MHLVPLALPVMLIPCFTIVYTGRKVEVLKSDLAVLYFKILSKILFMNKNFQHCFEGLMSEIRLMKHEQPITTKDQTIGVNITW